MEEEKQKENSILKPNEVLSLLNNQEIGKNNDKYTITLSLTHTKALQPKKREPIYRTRRICPYAVLNLTNHDGVRLKSSFCMVPKETNFKVLSSKCKHTKHNKPLSYKVSFAIFSFIINHIENKIKKEINILELINQIYISTQSEENDVYVTKEFNHIKITFTNVVHIDEKLIKNRNKHILLKTRFNKSLSEADVYILNCFEETEESKLKHFWLLVISNVFP